VLLKGVPCTCSTWKRAGKGGKKRVWDQTSTKESKKPEQLALTPDKENDKGMQGTQTRAKKTTGRSPQDTPPGEGKTTKQEDAQGRKENWGRKSDKKRENHKKKKKKTTKNKPKQKKKKKKQRKKKKTQNEREGKKKKPMKRGTVEKALAASPPSRTPERKGGRDKKILGGVL